MSFVPFVFIKSSNVPSKGDRANLVSNFKIKHTSHKSLRPQKIQKYVRRKRTYFSDHFEGSFSSQSAQVRERFCHIKWALHPSPIMY